MFEGRLQVDGMPCIPDCDFNANGSCFEFGAFPGLGLLSTTKNGNRDHASGIGGKENFQLGDISRKEVIPDKEGQMKTTKSNR